MVNRMWPIGTKRKFGGKVYIATAHYANKSEVTRQARNARKYGDLARITSVSDKKGKTFYTLWTRNK